MRLQRSRKRGIFGGSDAPRLASMILTLLVLFMLMRRAGDPETWRWLASDDTPVAAAPGNAAPNTDTGDDAAAPVAGEPAPPAAAASSAPKPPAAKEPPLEPTGPTDEDIEEQDALREELQAVQDKALQHDRVEMQAYDRLVRWAKNQPVGLLRQRATRNLLFHEFAQFPDKWRGKIVELQLNVRRIIKYDEPNRDGIQLYEVWGWTNEAKGWLYCGVVVDLPKGMPIGPAVYENARLVGYFFKLQGYHAVGAKPNEPALYAPLIVGRLVWQPSPAPQVQQSDWLWITVAAVVLLLVATIAAGMFLFGSGRKKHILVVSHRKPQALNLDDWLELAEQGKAPPDPAVPSDAGNNPPAAGEDKDERPPRHSAEGGSSTPPDERFFADRREARSDEDTNT